MCSLLYVHIIRVGSHYKSLSIRSKSHSITSSVSATVNLASVLLRTSSTSTPGASSVSVSSPVFRLTWKTHYSPSQSPASIIQLISTGSIHVCTHQVCNNRANHVRSCQWQTALLHDLRRSILGHMTRGHDDLCLVRVRDQIHGATHALEYLAGDHVIGEVAVGADLQGLEGRLESTGQVKQFGFLAVRLTPKMDTSTCPPRIIPKDSVLSKVAAPGTRVTVSLPALMMSLSANQLTACWILT